MVKKKQELIMALKKVLRQMQDDDIDVMSLSFNTENEIIGLQANSGERYRIGPRWRFSLTAVLKKKDIASFGEDERDYEPSRWFD